MDIIIEIWKDPIEITVALDIITIHASTYAIYTCVSRTKNNTGMHTK